MRFAILSFTEPPGEVHSSFPTEEVSSRFGDLRNATTLTEIALETFVLCNPVEADEGSIPDCVEDRFEYGWHFRKDKRKRPLIGEAKEKRWVCWQARPPGMYADVCYPTP
jgi:hypothetical protein